MLRSPAAELAHSVVAVDGWCTKGGQSSFPFKTLQPLWKLSFWEVFELFGSLHESLVKCWENLSGDGRYPGADAPTLCLALPKPWDALV